MKCLYPSKKADRLICKQIVPLRSGRLKGVWCIYVASYMFPSLGLLCTANDAWDALESLQSHVCSAVERCWRCSTFLNLVLCPLLVCVSFYLNVLLFMHIFHPHTMQQQRHETVSIMQIAHKAMAQGRIGASYCSLARQSNRSGKHDVTQRVQRTHIDNARVYRRPDVHFWRIARWLTFRLGIKFWVPLWKQCWYFGWSSCEPKCMQNTCEGC